MALVSKTFSQIITFTRASTATYFDSAGVLQSAAIDVPRFDYDPATLAARGFLIEEARTNIVASSVYTANANGWSNGVVGGGVGSIASASVNSPAGTTAGVFNISGLNGSSYVGQFSTVTASANARTGSVFVKNNGGVKFQIRLIFQTGGTFVSYGTEYDFNTTAFQDGIAGTTAPTSRSVTDVGNGWLRITVTGSDNGTGNTQASLQFWGAATTTNYNYLMWGAQIEEASAGASAAFATSYIPTTTTALTRSADVAAVNTLSPWYNSAAGTIFCQGLTPPGLANFPAIGPAFSDGTTSNRMIQYVFTNGFYGAATTSGASQGNTAVSVTPTIGAQYKFATAYANNDSQSALNGTASTVDSTYTVPTVNQMQINTGGAASANLPNSWIQRITYYPRRLSQAELTAITA